MGRTTSGVFHRLAQAFLLAIARLDKSTSPSKTIQKLRNHRFKLSDLVYGVHFLLACFWFTIMQSPPFPYKLLIPILWILALLIPATSQFFLPATPIFSYLLAFYSSRFVSPAIRPSVSVAILPTLESVLYGANISDILTHFTHPVLDVIAWLPYGFGHFTIPFAVAIFAWLFRSKQVLVFWASVFGWMNLTGVLIQILFPCSPPWYEVIHGLVPANYSMKGSPGGLLRIDKLFNMSMYNNAFSNSPMVFGAFPSLHAGSATMEALFLAHFFPHLRKVVWCYTAVLYWATMYLTHHYLIDVVVGACMSTVFFYLFLPDELKGSKALEPPANFPRVPGSARVGGGRVATPRSARTKYETYDIEEPRRAQDFEIGDEFDGLSDDEVEVDITYRSPVVSKFPNGQAQSSGGGNKAKNGVGKAHRHTASIASLIRNDERGPEEGWSPVMGSFGGVNGGNGGRT